MTNKISHSILLLSFLCLIFSCKTPNQSQIKSIPFLPNQPQILFLNLTIEQKGEKASVDLVEKRLANGTLKKDYKTNAQLKPLHLRCSFLDKNQIKIKETIIPNPLNQRYEYTDDNGQLKSKMVVSESGQITLRTQVVPDLYFLKVEHIHENGHPELIKILAL